MKVTLNDVIPAEHRHAAEAIILRMAPAAEIVWLPSRFPRLVMFVQPNFREITKDSETSIFSEESSRSEFAFQLEDQLQRGLPGLQSKG